jgi:putative oxidoreductase
MNMNGQRRGGLIGLVQRLHNGFFGAIENMLGDWFVSFSARFAFASVLGWYYFNSGWLKLGDGIFGFLSPNAGAFATILPPVMEQAGFDTSAIAFFPYHVIVILGTWGELLLPLLIVLGLFTRIAALGMIIFIVIQSYVDIVYHGLEAKFVGKIFDGAPDAIIYDQRLLWCFVLLVLVIKGGGKLSLDALFSRLR